MTRAIDLLILRLSLQPNKMNDSHSMRHTFTKHTSVHSHAHKTKSAVDHQAVDPVVMYESLRNRIAALEEEEEHADEEERQYGTVSTAESPCHEVLFAY